MLRKLIRNWPKLMPRLIFFLLKILKYAYSLEGVGFFLDCFFWCLEITEPMKKRKKNTFFFFFSHDYFSSVMLLL